MKNLSLGRSFGRAALVVVILAGSLGAAVPAAAEEVNIYSYRKEALIRSQLESFSKATGISYNLITGSAGTPAG